MELTELRNSIINAFSGSRTELQKILDLVEEDQSVFPFNAYEYLLSHAIDRNGITFQQYLEIRSEYISQNPNLWIFEISAPRSFGEKFAQTYVQGKCPALRRPSRKLDPDYNGAYDLWLDGIRVEVKASRAVDSDSSEPLYIKALSRDTTKHFWMNFQQLKPQYCDVFVWVAVFRDEILLWIMSSQEVQNNSLYSAGQHRGNSGNEGQLHVTHENIHLLSDFELGAGDLGDAILAAAQRNR